MNIFIGISIVVIMIFYFRNINLRDRNDSLKKTDTRQKNDLAIYFNTLMQYRNLIIKNNIKVPGSIPDINEINNKSYSIDNILDEIAEKGIENISQDKLNFLINTTNGKK